VLDTVAIMVTPLTVVEVVDIFAVAMLVLHSVGISYSHWQRTVHDRYERRFQALEEQYMRGFNLHTRIVLHTADCTSPQQVRQLLDSCAATAILQDTIQRNLTSSTLDSMESALLHLVDWFAFVRSQIVHPRLV
jgi:hypothetical protein